MPGVGFNTVFKKQCPTVFKVKNIANEGKRIKIFTLPIKNGYVRDLMAIPHVSEADIRHSLLKGELNRKILAKEIYIVESNIDLLQFDPCHKQFLIDAGITVGLDAGIQFSFKQGIELIGVLNDDNRTFTTPEIFINGSFGNNEFRILVKHNGRDLVETIDYFVSESGGSGSGFDTIILTFSPSPESILVADYVVEA